MKGCLVAPGGTETWTSVGEEAEVTIEVEDVMIAVGEQNPGLTLKPVPMFLGQ